MATDDFTQSPSLLPDQSKLLDPFADLVEAYEALSDLSSFDDVVPEIKLLRLLNKNFRMLLDLPESQPYLT